MSKRVTLANARELRRHQTKAESILWSLLRGKQLCGLKFRRQHPVPPFILDFACLAKMLAIEIDGNYHDAQLEKDKAREAFLKQQGWTIVRFTNDQILADPESVAISIARHLGLHPDFQKRRGGLSSVVDRQRLDRDATHRKTSHRSEHINPQ